MIRILTDDCVQGTNTFISSVQVSFFFFMSLNCRNFLSLNRVLGLCIVTYCFIIETLMTMTWYLKIVYIWLVTLHSWISHLFIIHSVNWNYIALYKSIYKLWILSSVSQGRYLKFRCGFITIITWRIRIFTRRKKR